MFFALVSRVIARFYIPTLWLLRHQYISSFISIIFPSLIALLLSLRTSLIHNWCFYKSMNALLDYGSSSNDSEDDYSQEAPKESAKPKLPKPSLGENALHCSVFSNPFAEAELAKAAILEKHVKMVPGKDGTQMINGKKICWNYRKGRCRFGHNCKYAHDSDIQKSLDEIEDEKKKFKAVVCESAGLSSPPRAEEESATDDSQWESTGPAKRKRPGLSQTLVPGKKVMNMYKKLKQKDVSK